ncbi:glycerophosphodiester phosphodiesterase [Cohnella herbarum]|uniref:Glycerophosphodiester phosphodiesterase n=1 Tax=Cohnella herbarum TaxID=2728023 RepID=A0A7Z2VPT5_9BACL|nr:glycerophosphodiester phosphodiesterase [Cohnella herbarum]QJD87243.1 glycerophosphodiester phosphodiesterase [Cohnella herbarum]
MAIHHKPLIIAHRGAAGEAPENTLAAFRLGMEQGCDAIELDIHLSKDGEIIVCHDETIDRTSDGTGAIRELTVAEIKRADAGGWFSEKYAGERIPLLEEVFELVPSSIMINIEIKSSFEQRLETTLARLLRRTARLSSVVVSSFDFNCLAVLKQIEPEARIGLLYEDKATLADPTNQLTVPVYSLHPYFGKLDIEDAREAVRQGLRVYPWTVNGEEQIRLMIEYGVSGVITDYPGRMKKILGS